MSFILVQLWAPSSGPNERFMGDSTAVPVPIGNNFNLSPDMGPGVPKPASNPSLDQDSRAAQQEKSQNPPSNTNYPQYPTFPSQISQHRTDAFNMANVGGALPDMPYQNYNNVILQRQMPGHSPSYPIQGMSQFPTSQASSPSMIAYGVPYQGQYNTMYPAHHVPLSHQMQAPTTNSQFFSGQGYSGQLQQIGSPFYLQSSQYGPQAHMFSAASPQYASKAPYSGEVRQQTQQGVDHHLSTGASGGGRPNSIGILNFS